MNPNPPATRPTLLTVICVLSFIMGVWGIISGVGNFRQDGEKVLLTDAAGFNQLRRDPNYLRGGDLGGPNLLRSQIVLNDRAGESVGPVILAGRVPPGGRLLLWRTDDAGATWQPTAGLPEDAWAAVLRDAASVAAQPDR